MLAKLATYRMKRTDPRTDPSGIEQIMYVTLEETPSTTTLPDK